MDIIIFWSCLSFCLSTCILLFFQKQCTLAHIFYIFCIGSTAILYWILKDFDVRISRQILVTLFSLGIAFYTFLIYPKMVTIITRYPGLSRIGQVFERYGIIFFVVFFFSVFCFITISRHIHFQTTGFDLGLFDQAVYQYSQGIFPAGSSIRGVTNIESDHFNPVLILFS